MRIGMNGWFLSRPYTGIAQYTQHLLRAMAKQAPHHEWVVAVTELCEDFDFPENVRLVHVPERRLPTAGLRKWWWEQRQVPECFQEENVDLAHYPYPANPRRTPKSSATRDPSTTETSHPTDSEPPPIKTLVTVHDVIPWSRPEYRRRLRTRLYQNHVRKSLKKANHLISVSQATAMELTNYIAFPFKKITTIHEAPSPVFNKAVKPFTKKRPYFIYVGGYDSRKNVPRLVQAFQEYIAPQYEIDLVLVGARNTKNPHYRGLKELHQFLKDHERKAVRDKQYGRIHTTGMLPQERLAQYYRGAIALVNVSLAEGFNIPLLEAAACETPILTSDLDIHREVISDHGLFCDPKNVQEIGKMMLHFLRKPELQDKLKAQTYAIRNRYSWEKAAQETLEVYRTLI